MFPFRAGSPLLHSWGIHELLPDNCTEASVQKKWAHVRESLFQSHQRMAQKYNKRRIPQPFKFEDMVFLENTPSVMPRVQLLGSCDRVGPGRLGCNLLSRRLRRDW